MHSIAIFLGCFATISIYVNGCGVPCQDPSSGTCCIRGSCGCVEMGNDPAGCNPVPGPGSCSNTSTPNITCCDRPDTSVFPNPCFEGCACCPDGSVAGSIGDGQTFYCPGIGQIKKGVNDDQFGEFCDSGLSTTEIGATEGIYLLYIFWTLFLIDLYIQCSKKDVVTEMNMMIWLVILDAEKDVLAVQMEILWVVSVMRSHIIALDSV